MVKSVNYYLNGFPCVRHILTFEKAMNLLMQQPLRIYQKVLWNSLMMEKI